MAQDQGGGPTPSSPRKVYPEITVSGILLGLVVGLVLTACWTYVGLLLGFTIPGSEIAAIIGFGVLRGIMRRRSIIENNINQTVASGINIASAGVIFTVPALYLMGVKFNPWMMMVACMAGSLLGVAFIIPLRKQMIDLDRLRFPSGTAVAAILKSPGAGVRKAVLLGVGLGICIVIVTLQQLHVIPEYANLGKAIGLPPYVVNVWALSLLSVGAGFISGRPGLVVVIGGVLANWVIAPVAVNIGWMPEGLKVVEYGRYIYGQMNRPIGIGMLIGGAVMGIVLALPAVKAAFASLKTMEQGRGQKQELPLKVLYIAAGAALVVLFLATRFAAPGLGLWRTALVALLGTGWLWLAGIIVAQCTGMTDWSPMSGLSLIAVTILLFLTSGIGQTDQVVAAVVVGAAVCIAIGQCADMMQDLKTGHLVGARPASQQMVQLAVTWIGPVVAILVLGWLWKTKGFGPGKALTAPQGQALQAAVQGVLGGDVPYGKYLFGGLLGGALSVSGIGGLGVLVGLSMYLPFMYILPFGLGCVVNMTLQKTHGPRLVEEQGVPLAAGLIVGESLVMLIFAVIKVFS